MAKIEVDYRDYFRLIAEALRGGGMLLVSVDRAGRPNAMTIGWAALGPVWGRPAFMAMVRPSRYTYGLIEESGDFTVNLLPKELARVLDFCGSRSGRDVDKFAAQGLTPVPGRKVKSPTVEQAIFSLECVVRGKADLSPEMLDPAIDRSAYPRGDYHRLYFGEILAAYAEPALTGK